MSVEKMPQFHSKDGCVYIYNTDEKKWYMFCPTETLPVDVRCQVMELKEKADMLKDV